MHDIRFSANVNTFNACADRYVLSGYGQRLTTDELIQMATKVPGLTGLEVVGFWHVNDDNVAQVNRRIHDAGFEVTCVTPDIWASAKWGRGSFASNDPAIRRAAIDEVKKSMVWAQQMNCTMVDLWFGQDGYDYPLQADYQAPGTASSRARSNVLNMFPMSTLSSSTSPKSHERTASLVLLARHFFCWRRSTSQMWEL